MILRRNPNPTIKPACGACIDWSHPLAQGLVGCWLLNEGGGSKIYDLSGHANHLAPGTAPSWDANGLLFDNANSEYLTKSSPNGLELHQGTMLASFQSDEYTAFDYRNILSRYTSFNPPYAYFLLYDSGSVHNVYIRLGTDAELDTGVDITEFALATIAVTYDADGNYAVHKDGIESASGTYTVGTDTTNSPIYLGSRNSTSYFWSGDIRYAYWYNFALSADLVSWLHAEPYANILAPQYWHMVDFGAAVTTGRISLYGDMNGLGGMGQQHWNPLG
jgi:hypothetical protein